MAAIVIAEASASGGFCGVLEFSGENIDLRQGHHCLDHQQLLYSKNKSSHELC